MATLSKRNIVFKIPLCAHESRLGAANKGTVRQICSSSEEKEEEEDICQNCVCFVTSFVFTSQPLDKLRSKVVNHENNLARDCLKFLYVSPSARYLVKSCKK
jgi:hypothetical protein